MKKNSNINIDRKELLRAVRVLERAAPRKTKTPILDNYLLSVENGTLTLVSTDLDSAARCTVNVDFIGDVSACIHGATFSKLIGTLNEDNVELDLSGSDAIIRRDRGDIKLRTVETKNYPNLIFGDVEKVQFKFRRVELLEALRLAGFALETNTELLSKDAFKGSTLLRITTDLIESHFEMTSTNGPVLSLVSGVCSKGLDVPDDDMVLSRVAIIQIVAILNSATEDEVFFSEDANHLFVNIGTVSYSFRKMTVNFPDLSKATTTEFPIAFTVNSSEILDALKRMEIFYNQQTHRIEMEVNDEELIFSAQDADRGSIEESFAIKLIGSEPFTTAFNIHFLSDVFTRTDDEITVRFVSSGVGYAMKAQKTGDTVKADFYVQGMQNVATKAA